MMRSFKTDRQVVVIAACAAIALLSAMTGSVAWAQSPSTQPPSADDAKLAAQGQKIVETNCARCHSTGREGASPLAKAPPFRTLSKRYPLDSLAEALAEGIVTGHNEMPQFRFQPDEIDAILTYLGSISPP